MRLYPLLTWNSKDKPIGRSFDQRFSLNEALDAAADTYIGVST